ncbi:hypothetical protein ABPG75_012955 [Micractinium tetrahymenae]
MVCLNSLPDELLAAVFRNIYVNDRPAAGRLVALSLHVLSPSRMFGVSSEDANMAHSAACALVDNIAMLAQRRDDYPDPLLGDWRLSLGARLTALTALAELCLDGTAGLAWACWAKHGGSLPASLTRLHLGEPAEGDLHAWLEGPPPLPDSLPQLTALQALSLELLRAGPWAHPQEQLEAALQALTGLTRLELEGSGITFPAAATTLPRLAHLVCYISQPHQGPGQPAVESLPPGPYLLHLRQLEVAQAALAASLVVLAAAPQLQRLEVQQVGDALLPLLGLAAWAAHLPALRTVSFSRYFLPEAEAQEREEQVQAGGAQPLAPAAAPQQQSGLVVEHANAAVRAALQAAADFSIQVAGAWEPAG